VAHAHGRLVLHRDLKPANVLVDAGGHVHLLDFGIAKLLDDTGAGADLTQEQGRVLTLNYASPEQIAGRPLGVTADVYALGVMLYELLTGALPYSLKRNTAGAMEDAILAGDAALVSTRVADKRLARELRGDLDAIVAKAIKRDPNERYPTPTRSLPTSSVTSMDTRSRRDLTVRGIGCARRSSGTRCR
jgi:serine/threonine-protein kinase